MKEAILFLMNGYRTFHGTGMYFGLYLIGMVYLWYRLKKEDRTTYIYPFVLILAALWNPVVTQFVWMKLFDYLTIPRIYNVLFITVFIAFAAAWFISEIPSDKKKLLWIGIFSIIIVSCGNLKFSNAAYAKAENLYRFPDYAIDMADTILADNEEPKIAVPYEIAHYFRGYSTKIKLLFGENATYGRIESLSSDTNEYKVYEQLLLETPDLERIAQLTEAEDCDYIVFNTTFHEFEDEPQAYGFQSVGVFGDYELYRCNE